jgi:hypothetical protein
MDKMDKMDKKEVFTELRKALHRAIAKAYFGGNTIVHKALDGMPSKEHSLKHILADIEDPDMIAETPKNHIPASKESVLNKDDDGEKGVHVSKNPKKPGRSIMGILSNLKEWDKAKEEAKRVIREQKEMDEPNIPEPCPNCGYIKKNEGDQNLQQLHNMKEAQAKAKVGLRPGEKAPMTKSNMGEVFMNEKGQRGLECLKKFMMRREEKRGRNK